MQKKFAKPIHNELWSYLLEFVYLSQKAWANKLWKCVISHGRLDGNLQLQTPVSYPSFLIGRLDGSLQLQTPVSCPSFFIVMRCLSLLWCNKIENLFIDKVYKPFLDYVNSRGLRFFNWFILATK